MAARSGGASASSLLPWILSLPRIPPSLHQGNFMLREPSGSVDPGPPGVNTTVPSGQRPTRRAGFRSEIHPWKTLLPSLVGASLSGGVTGQLVRVCLLVFSPAADLGAVLLGIVTQATTASRSPTEIPRIMSTSVLLTTEMLNRTQIPCHLLTIAPKKCRSGGQLLICRNR